MCRPGREVSLDGGQLAGAGIERASPDGMIILDVDGYLHLRSRRDPGTEADLGAEYLPAGSGGKGVVAADVRGLVARRIGFQRFQRLRAVLERDLLQAEYGTQGSVLGSRLASGRSSQPGLTADQQG